jgi:hypothetical protein
MRIDSYLETEFVAIVAVVAVDCTLGLLRGQSCSGGDGGEGKKKGSDELHDVVLLMC